MPNCKGKTTIGKRCKNKCKSSDKYCRHHCKKSKGGNVRFPTNNRFGRINVQKCPDYQKVCKNKKPDLWTAKCFPNNDIRYNKKIQEGTKICADKRKAHAKCRHNRGEWNDEGHLGAIEKMINKSRFCNKIIKNQEYYYNKEAPQIRQEAEYVVRKVRSVPTPQRFRRN